MEEAALSKLGRYERMLWVALWGSGQIGRWNPKGEESLQSIAVPGFVIPGTVNDGPIANPGPRCPRHFGP